MNRRIHVSQPKSLRYENRWQTTTRPLDVYGSHNRMSCDGKCTWYIRWLGSTLAIRNASIFPRTKDWNIPWSIRVLARKQKSSVLNNNPRFIDIIATQFLERIMFFFLSRSIQALALRKFFPLKCKIQTVSMSVRVETKD